MQALRKVASALSFAHLAGLGRAVKASAEDDKPEDDKPEDDKPEDDEDKKSKVAKAKAEGEQQDEDSKRAADDKPDEGDDGKKSAADDKPDEGDDDKKSKAKAKADDEDDSDEEMSGKSAAGAARLREQARCAAIFASPAAASNPVLAANLAFTTRMSRASAVALLKATPAPAAVAPALPGNAARSAARNPNLGTGGVAPRSSTETVAKSWDAAFAKANPRRA